MCLSKYALNQLLFWKNKQTYVYFMWFHDETGNKKAAEEEVFTSFNKKSEHVLIFNCYRTKQTSDSQNMLKPDQLWKKHSDNVITKKNLYKILFSMIYLFVFQLQQHKQHSSGT